jgi:hypothetical protein
MFFILVTQSGLRNVYFIFSDLFRRIMIWVVDMFFHLLPLPVSKAAEAMFVKLINLLDVIPPPARPLNPLLYMLTAG